jgi:pyruvate,water dikinase
MTNEDCEWSRANFKETMPDLPSPMGLSFLERFMDAYIVSHYRRLGCDIPRGVSSVRVYAGRPYLNVTLFHMLVGQLGGDPTLNAEQMGGDPVQSAPSVRPLAWWALLRAGWLMWREMRRVRTESATSFASMKALASHYTREKVRSLSLADARNRLDELGRWLDSREVTFGIAAGAGQCLQVFSRVLPRWLGADWRRLLNESLQGQGTVISAQQILQIAALVTLAREDAAVTDAFRHGWAPGDYRRILSGSRFLAAFDHYLDDYGHRAVGESDIMSPRLSDHPETVLGVIKTQLLGASATPAQLISRQKATRNDALATIRARCGWRVDRWLMFRWWYRRLCRFFTLREANRHHLMWYSQAARHLLLRVGELLVDHGLFSHPDDIFFLTLNEVEHLDRPPADTWASLIRTRRRERERWCTVHVSDVIRSAEAQQPPGEPTEDLDGVLRGLPVSSGIVSGPVRFVRVTGDWSRVRRGDIIVAPVIDPGMAPLFGIAGGLIVEMGGTLSHGAIIAREYGLPAIANVSRAMSLLSEDERVTMDATNGVVRRQ